MLSQPQFKPHYHIEWVEGEGVFLLSESEQQLLRGQSLRAGGSPDRRPPHGG